MPMVSGRTRATFRSRAFNAALTLLWAALIFAASSRPDLRIASDDTIDLIVRKSLHMIVFGVLLTLVIRTIRGPSSTRGRHLLGAWIATLAYACSDEWHQTFVPGRLGQPSDVVIDMVGASIAGALVHRHRNAATTTQERPS